ncbi:MAG TPA: hypothetical protein VH500_06185 [Nitrososphaeraceae archaeon]|jgi:hypothetical protein
MNISRIQSVIPFISFPIGVTSIILLIIEFDVRMTVIVNNPISQLILFAGIMTNISMSLLSVRARKESDATYTKRRTLYLRIIIINAMPLKIVITSDCLRCIIFV